MSENMIPKVYDPKLFEKKWYEFWETSGFFHAEVEKDKKPFSIVIPPPNVTGQLHMGHAMDNTLQDILIRWRRMQGYNTLWMPGCDHAGIATQAKVEESLREEGLSRYDLGREKFLERVWAWKEKYGSRIMSQLRSLGSSLDWDRERFTMDEGCSRAVREVFVSLYEEGLIYQGMRITNWCPRCNTALSDLEVEHETEQGHLWHLVYPVEGSDEKVEIATTRPETMFGDTGVAVHPDDERYKHLIGKTLILPVVGRRIPLFADEYVDPKFGTGAVKVTPAHDPNDFEMGNRHNLEQVKVIENDGTMGEGAGKYAGLDRYECPQAAGQGIGRDRRPRQDREARARGGPLLPLPYDGGTAGVEAVVREDGVAGETRHRGGERRAHQVRTGALRENLHGLARKHPRLVHFPPALVGPSDSGLVLRRLRRGVGFPRGHLGLPEVRQQEYPAGRGRAGYLVQLRALAL